ncbi:nucleotide sugar dehydrogenase [Spiractinospora alimapuensis]|uniref:nucleotide sugar dehydrogenase n=1 Tax=Spiractinospora alimapuensis TaxID=2820884 RepID=UPI001F290A67|nr:nucleotide sugar dehydrogenase [Spiractinospora alimapuensis]QVQ54397.1 nucleotide sugar dehydrogenase [Spiractinospora alimapuensis]
MDAPTSSNHSPPDLVVVGLGYVGLPLARQATHAGLRVAGFDVNRSVVTDLGKGRSHVDDVNDDALDAMLAAGFLPTDEPEILRHARTIVICVPTPLSGEGGPDLTAVTSAVSSIAAHLTPGTLVVLESTTYPGTTEEVVRPLLERSGLAAGEDFHLAYSPERVDPGNTTYDVGNTPKVVGGVTPGCAEAAAAFYGRFVQQVVRARGTREAEMAKLLENTYRHVNIALVNEMAVFCRELDVDLWDSIACAATKPFGFQAFYPGPGVGGHCIPIDPNYLSYKVRTLGYPFRFVELAQEINARMPAYVTMRAQDLLNTRGLALSRSRVLLLGVTYKPDIADQRESPAQQVASRLRAHGARLRYHDPHVDHWAVNGEPVDRAERLEEGLADTDLAILLTDHGVYTRDLLEKYADLLLDTRGVLRRPTAGDEGNRASAVPAHAGLDVL